ncbi:DUF3253 domain-containing protein [Streptomyces rishiriensis]|uniref:S-adenosylmethionine tRNA ribosyltransferase n=1 Tax=Streptomyces rishiriensis TaxID=68264 RepID=A0ABU0P2E1_STRRH|nr:DUF3253 domain-containing protein [Streptomyces rishiriensis]MDQ0585534.1 hypothetical protein [Streptomyces rishiriensis]
MASDEDERLERAILDLLGRRRPDVSICPSEVARSVHPGTDDGWRRLMEPTRAAAQRLSQAGLVEITQAGEPVDPTTARGPIRIRRTR